MQGKGTRDDISIIIAPIDGTDGDGCIEDRGWVVVQGPVVSYTRSSDVATKFYISRNRYFQLPPTFTYIGIGTLNEDPTSSATCRQVLELG